MTTDERIAQVCERAVADRVFPGCTVGYIADAKTHAAAFGRFTYDNSSTAVALDTIYDVASVTKSIPTAAIALMLVEQGRLSLDDAVVRWIPELQNEYRNEILVRHLLTYTVIFDVPGGMSKLAQDYPDEFLPRLFAAPLLAAPGTKYFYTNGPAILLGLVVERLTGMRLDVLARDAIFEPLEMDDTAFGPVPDTANVAPSQAKAGKDYVGSVQDPSASAMAAGGALSGAAGLFSTTPDLLEFMGMLVRGGTTVSGRRLFTESTVSRFGRNELTNLGATAAFGWELDRQVFMGTSPTGTFGKTGFTGCVVLANLEQKRALVLLSNRTYPDASPDRDAINAVRRNLADIVFAAIR